MVGGPGYSGDNIYRVLCSHAISPHGIQIRCVSKLPANVLSAHAIHRNQNDCFFFLLRCFVEDAMGCQNEKKANHCRGIKNRNFRHARTAVMSELMYLQGGEVLRSEEGGAGGGLTSM